MGASIFAVCGLLVLSGLVSGQLKYSCDVHGEATTAQSCTLETGVQVCNANHFGYKCEQGGGTCPTAAADTCDHVGTVEDSNTLQCDSTNDACICKEGFQGARCDERMLTATCDASQMQVIIKNYVPLDGQAFAHSYYFSETTTFDFTGADGCAEQTNTDATYTSEAFEYTTAGGCTAEPQVDGTNRVLYLYIQHISTVQLKTDQVYKLICDPAGGEATVQPVASPTVTITPVDSTHSAAQNAIMDLKTDDNAGNYGQIIGPVALGDGLSLIIQHPSIFTLKDCLAADNSAFSSPLTLIDSTHCAVRPSHLLFAGDIAYAPTGSGDSQGGVAANYVYRLPVKAWAWPSSNRLFMKCFLCFAQSCATDNPTCTNPTTSIDDVLFAQYASLVARRRRSAIESGATIELSVSVTVGDSSIGAGNVTLNDGTMTNSEVDVGKCYNSISVLLPIILLAVLLLVAMVMTFFFCTRVLRDREMAAGSDNMAYKS